MSNEDPVHPKVTNEYISISLKIEPKDKKKKEGGERERNNKI